MDIPSGYTVRRARREDLADWVRVCAAVDVAETGEVDYDEKAVLAEWERPRFELERDAWVVLDSAGEVVGHAHAWELAPGARVTVDTFVLPELAEELEGPVLDLGLGEGDRLITELGGEGITLQVSSVRSNTLRTDALVSRGFVTVRQFLRMHIDLDDTTRQATRCDAAVRAYDRHRDERAVHDVLTRAFSDHWGSQRETYPEWRARVVDAPGYDPSLWSVAEDGGDIVGALIAKADVDGRGWVSSVGVAVEHRGQRLGEALLLRTFEQFRDRGWTAAMLGVDADNSTGATRLYERVGMHVAFAVDLWQRRPHPEPCA